MAKQLSAKAIEAILDDIDLSASVTKILGLRKVTALYDTLKRNGRNVNQYNTIEAIAKAMGKKPNDILEEKELAKAL